MVQSLSKAQSEQGESLKRQSLASAISFRGINIGAWVEWFFASVFLAWIIWRLLHALFASWMFTTDDAYITLRYAYNLYTSHGIVWNPGEVPPVEGYSNFLFVLLGSLALKVGWNPILFFKILGAVSISGTFLATWLIARTWLGPLAALLPAYFLVGYPGEAYWAVSGLETTFYQALMTLSLAVFLKSYGFRLSPAGNLPGLPQKKLIHLGWWTISAFLAMLASLTRPDGPLIAVFFAAALLWRVRRSPRPWLIFGVVYLLPMAIYHVWRLAHFGQLLPHSVVCKAAFKGDPYSLLRDYWSLVSPFAFFVIITLWRRPDVRHGLLLGIPLTYGVLLYGMDPIIGYYNRHTLSAFALLLVPAAVGLAKITELILAPLGRHWRETALVAMVLLFGWFTRTDSTADLSRDAAHYARRMDKRAELNTWLAARVKPGDAVLIGDSGLVPYRLKAEVIDAYCLNCLEMSRPPIEYSSKRFADWVFRRSPRFLIVHSIRPDRLIPRDEYGIFPAIVAHTEFQRRYRHVTTIGASGDDFHYWVFER
jgi:hypothetical protein